MWNNNQKTFFHKFGRQSRPFDHGLQCFDSQTENYNTRNLKSSHVLYWVDGMFHWLQVAIDNYLDGGYHVPVCHKDLNELLEEDTYKTEVYDGFSVQSTSGNNSDSRLGEDALFIHIYPNTFINRYGMCQWLGVICLK